MRQIIVALLVGIVGVGTGMWGTQAAEEAAPSGTTPTTPAPAASAGGEAAPAGGGAAAGGACCKAGDTTLSIALEELRSNNNLPALACVSMNSDGIIEMAANTGTYIDSPFHRYGRARIWPRCRSRGWPAWTAS